MSTAKIIDWDLAKKRAGNKDELAREIFQMLLTDLPLEFKEIAQSYAKKDYPDMQRQVHKLHGAVRYCGVPRLQDALATLENTLKVNELAEVPSQYNTLKEEVDALLSTANA